MRVPKCSRFATRSLKHLFHVLYVHCYWLFYRKTNKYHTAIVCLDKSTLLRVPKCINCMLIASISAKYIKGYTSTQDVSLHSDQLEISFTIYEYDEVSVQVKCLTIYNAWNEHAS